MVNGLVRKWPKKIVPRKPSPNVKYMFNRKSVQNCINNMKI